MVVKETILIFTINGIRKLYRTINNVWFYEDYEFINNAWKSIIKKVNKKEADQLQIENAKRMLDNLR